MTIVIPVFGYVKNRMANFYVKNYRTKTKLQSVRTPNVNLGSNRKLANLLHKPMIREKIRGLVRILTWQREG